MKIRNNKAFSLADAVIALSIVGILFLMTAKNITKISLDTNLAKFKKAYTTLEVVIGNLINDEILYGTSSGFKDTDSVTIEKVGQVIGTSNVAKFREAFKYSVQFVEDKIDCPIYGGSSSSGCFQTDYGVVFGIPDTDFISIGTITKKDARNQNITVVPITFYTDYEPGQTVKDNAFVATITYDGKILFEYTDGVKCGDKSTEMQCKLKKYIQATSVKTSG